MNQIVTFGEVLMRISPLGNKKFIQSNTLEFYFGGTEVNVAISIANFGGKVKHISCISNDFVGDTAISYLRKFGIKTSSIVRSNRPLGVYFLEVGAVMRPSSISYNRSHSSFSEIKPNMVDWEASLKRCNWFHWTGITPALCEGGYHTLKEGLILAQKKGLEVSVDPTYRSGLWKYGTDPRETLSDLLNYSTIFIGGINEMNEVLETDYKYSNEDFIWNGTEFRETKDLDITHIVDRIGTGDAFAAGLIYGLQNFDDYKAMEFGAAASALKHTYEGDVNFSSVDEVMNILDGNTSGRFNR